MTTEACKLGLDEIRRHVHLGIVMSFRSQPVKSAKRAAFAGVCEGFRSFGSEAFGSEAFDSEAFDSEARQGYVIGGERLGWRGYSETWRRT